MDSDGQSQDQDENQNENENESESEEVQESAARQGSSARRVEIEEHQVMDGQYHSDEVVSADTSNTKKKQVPKFDKAFSNCRKFSMKKPSYCGLLRQTCCGGKSVELFRCDMVIKSVTCNKLTHCLFDFDTHELNRPGEAERFMFQMKKIQNIFVAIQNSQGDAANSKSQLVSPSLIPYTTSTPSDIFDVDETFDDFSLYLPNRQQIISYK